MSSIRFVMIGGFLGAGKTTAVAALARRLTEQGKRVGLITNQTGLDSAGVSTIDRRSYDRCIVLPTADTEPICVSW